MPSNEWPQSEPPTALRGEGWEVGQVVPDLRLLDQHGDEVSLWQLWDHVVMVSFSAMWCSPCHHFAVEAEQLAAQYGDRGFVHVILLLEDGSGLPVTVEDAALYAGDLALQGPVLADTEQQSNEALAGSFPRVLLLDRSLVVATELDSTSSMQSLASLIESEL